MEVPLCVFHVHVCLCVLVFGVVMLPFTFGRVSTPPRTPNPVWCWSIVGFVNATCSKVIVVHDLVA